MKRAKTLGRSSLASGSRLYEVLFQPYLGHQSIWRKAKSGNKLTPPETSCTFPSERSFALLDIHIASHKPTVQRQPPLKSARITYDTISCNNEATKEREGFKGHSTLPNSTQNNTRKPPAPSARRDRQRSKPARRWRRNLPPFGKWKYMIVILICSPMIYISL